jgi:MFS family permease
MTSTDLSPTRTGPPPTAAPVRRRGGLLRTHRDFRLLWTGETVSKLGSNMGSFSLPLVASVSLNASTFTMGVLTAVYWLPWLVIALPAGAWVDRLPRRPVMMICNVASMLLVGSVPVAAWLGLLTVAQVLAVALLTGVASVFFSIAYGAFVPSLVDRADLLEANTKMKGSESAMQIVGPGAAGLLAQAIGTTAGMLGQALAFLFSTTCLRAIRTQEERRVSTRKASLRRDVAAGLRFVTADPFLRVLMTFGAVSNLALTGCQAVQIVFLVHVLHVGGATIGVLYSVASVGGLTGALLAGRIARRFGTARGALLCQLCAAPFFLLTPMTEPGARLALFALGGFGVGTGVVASNIICNSFRQSYCPQELRGRVSATMATVNYGSIPLGGLLGGVLGNLFGPRTTIWAMAVLMMLACSILVASPLRTMRDFPTALTQ